MRKAFPLVLTLLIALLLAACGSPANPSPTQPTLAGGAAAPPTQSASSGAETSAPTQAASSGGATQVQVTLADNTIQSSLTTFQVGVPYTFVITNSGRHAHDFNIAPPVDVAGSLDAALKAALLVVPQSKLGVGQSVTVDFTFPASVVGAQLEFSCLIPRHYEAGMRLPITVTK